MSRTRSRASQKADPPATRQAVPWRGLAIAAVVVGAVVVLVLLDPPPPGVAYPDLGNNHLSTPSEPHAAYNSSPPSSGPHYGGLADWGVSQDTVPPEIFVHNLEDGGVVVTYDCPQGCDELSQGLSDYVLAAGGRLLLTPYAGIVDEEGTPRRAAAIAWTRVFYFDDLDEATVGELDTFVELYEGVDHHVAGVG